MQSSYPCGRKFIFAVMLLLSGCGGSGGSDDPVPVVIDPPDGSDEQAPTIAGVLPSPAVGGQTVKVSGSNLDDVSITFNGVAVAPALQNAHEIRFVLPPNAVGSYPLSLENESGVASMLLRQASALANVVQVAAGNDYSCAVVSTGAIYCWGSSSLGQLGGNPAAPTSAPSTVSGVSSVLSMSTGDGNSCAVLGAGEIRCWGKSSFMTSMESASGVRIDPAPETINGISTAIAVSVDGKDRSCAVLRDGAVYCWTWAYVPPSTAVREQPVVVTGISDAVDVSMGGKYGCVLRATKQVSCWTSGDLQSYSVSGSPVAESVSGITDAIYISAGDNHVCALLTSGKVHCWGSNAFGQLGNGTTVDSATPVEVSGIDNATGISAKGDRSCATLSGGTVKCWGAFAYGYGGGDATSNLVPVAVGGIDTATTVSVGGKHNCVLDVSGEVLCWGGNWSGELGIDSPDDGNWLTPVTISGISNAAAVSSGYHHSCLVTTAGGVNCWGSNLLGELGNGTLISSEAPASVVGISTAKAAAVSSNHSCALLSDGAVQCWGGNAYGQLGNDSLLDSRTPVAVSGIDNAVAIATINDSASVTTPTCAILFTGEISCWGYGVYGFGDGSTESPVPMIVGGISDVAAISLGVLHACLVLDSGTVQCWGMGGALGDGTGAVSETPVQVVGISDAAAISTSMESSCALLTSGAVKCWGWKEYESPGSSELNSSTVPFGVDGIDNAVAIASGRNHHCVVGQAGTVQCWGNNEFGQLGNGMVANSNTPVTVTGIDAAVSISASDDRTCALLSDGYLQCWGAYRFEKAVVLAPSVPAYLR